MVSRTVPGSPGEECGLGVRWGRALTAWVPGLESVDQYGAGLGGSPQVWAGTSNNNRGPTDRLSRGSSRCRTVAHHVECQSDPSHVVRPL